MQRPAAHPGQPGRRRLSGRALAWLLLAAATLGGAPGARGEAAAPRQITVSAVETLTLPLVGDAYVAAWAAKVAPALYAFDPATLAQTANAQAERFTSAGWASYTSVLNQSGILGAVVNRNMAVTSAVDGAARVLDQGLAQDRSSWVWRVDVPLRITYGTQPTPTEQLATMTLLVGRVPVGLAPSGLALVGFALGERS